MKKAKVFMHDYLAGILTEDHEGFHFEYLDEYLQMEKAEAVSITLPLSSEKYSSLVLFPFFDGLIPEGWLLDITVNNWKLDRRDRMSILLIACKDCIGAVSIEEMETDQNV